MDPRETFQQIRQLKLTQTELKKKLFEAGSGDVKVVINGEMKVIDLKLPAKITPAIIKSLKTAFNSAIMKAQKNTLDAVKKLAA